MKIIISSFGSSGDFNPCLGLGRTLKQKGVDVVFLSNPYYEKKITDAGLRFHPAGEYWDVFKEIQDNPDYLHPRKGPKAVWNLVLRTVPTMFHAMTEAIEKEVPDMVACHILEFGGMIAACQKSVSYSTISPTPMGWFTTNPPGYLNYTELPLWLRRLQSCSIRHLMNIAMKYSLKRHVKKQGVHSPFDSIGQVYSQAVVNLGLWSRLLKTHCVDDPLNAKICGFVRDEHVCDWDDVPDKIQQLFSGSKRPVVAGLGSTASLHADAIYQRTAEVCKQLHQPCLLIGKALHNYADPERGIVAVDFAPYGWVFPLAAMVIHHGGLNTTAETLRAGVPALVIPHGYDQFDNAIRTGQLGLSKRLKPARVTSSAYESTIQSILNGTQMHENAKAFAAQLKSQPDGAEIAANCLIEIIQD